MCPWSKGEGVNLSQKICRDKWEYISPKVFNVKFEGKRLFFKCQESTGNLMKKGVGWNGEGTLN